MFRIGTRNAISNKMFQIIARRYLPMRKMFKIKNFTTHTAAEKQNTKINIKNGPGLKEFLIVGKNLPTPTAATATETEVVPYLVPENYSGNGRKVFFEVYGCQMNVNDTEIAWSILNRNNYVKCDNINDADVILVITCAIREGAEAKIWNRMKQLHSLKLKRSSKKRGPLQVGILGCMAERLKNQLVEKEQWVDVVAGPDSYKDLPRLLALTQNGASAVNVLLSLDETYADIMPVRLNKDSVTAYLSVMRGCDNMCTYCIVPFTRGRERSRPIASIESEVKYLVNEGIREITLLGQNVNSYRDISVAPVKTASNEATKLAPGFKTVYKPKIGGARFAELLERVAEIAPNVRFRFTSPHPKDFPDDVLEVIKKYPNICKSLHLPAQSGNSAVLERMRRGYSREAYIDLVDRVRSIIPDISLSSDFICGFCGETDNEFEDTLSLIKRIKYNVAYLFAYSMREKTTAHRRYKDDVPHEVKIKRLQEMVTAYREGAEELQSKFVGTDQLILIERKSKRSEECVFGRNDANIKVIIPLIDIPAERNGSSLASIKPGDYVAVRILDSNSQVLKGEPLYHTNLKEYHRKCV